jgi:hypothetical protein
MPKPGRGAEDIAKTCLAMQRGGTQTATSEDMEIAKALWQLSYAMFDFRGLLAFHGLRGTVWFWICCKRSLSKIRLINIIVVAYRNSLVFIWFDYPQ